MNGLLVRVGIDATDGQWNAPIDSRTGAFAYITITETKPIRSGLTRLYDDFEPALSRFGLTLPNHLVGVGTHLDPDFSTLTYGDQGRRAQQIVRLEPSDLLVFYASLRDVATAKLVYAIIGIYVIDKIVYAKNVEKTRWSENAHTRRIPGETDIVVRAKANVSGRLGKCIPIGEYRDKAYRVKQKLLNQWGNLTTTDGYLQRSAQLPAFRKITQFYDWFLAKRIALLRSNN